MRNSLYKTYAPICASPDCTTRVGYHSRFLKIDGTPSFKWKTFCERHRTTASGRAGREIFLLSKGGCENRDGRLGWTCGDPNTESLTIDHWDGNKHNNSQENLVVLCANCHNKKSKIFKDTTTRYRNYNEHFDNLFTEI